MRRHEPTDKEGSILRPPRLDKPPGVPRADERRVINVVAGRA